MGLSTTDAVSAVFREATRQSLASTLRRPEDWDRYKGIVEETTARIEAERAAFAADYPLRLAEAREVVLREEYGVRLDQPLPPGAQNYSNKEMLDHKAAFRVRQDHDRRIAAIKADELTAFQGLAREIRAREAPGPAQSQSLLQSPSQTRSGPTRSR